MNFLNSYFRYDEKEEIKQKQHKKKDTERKQKSKQTLWMNSQKDYPQ